MLLKVCPKCGNQNEVSAMYCSSCYTALKSVVATEQSAPEIKVKICPKCGGENKIDTVVCPTCFTPLVSVLPTVKGAPKKENASARVDIPQTLSYGNAPKKKDNKSSFAYQISNNSAFGILDAHIREIKNLVFNSAYVNSNPDYAAVAKSVHFIFNDFLEDKNTINAYATNVRYVKSVYEEEIEEIENAHDLEPVMIYFDGINMAIATISAAYCKYTSMGLSENECFNKLSDFLSDMALQIIAQGASFDQKSMCALDLKYDIFPAENNDALDMISCLAMSAASFIIGHELGHIIHGHVMSGGSRMVGAYSRNQERAADRFAADIIDSFEDENIKGLCFLGGIIAHFVFLSTMDLSKEVKVNDPREHPTAYERFSNYLDSNKELAARYGFAKETFEYCMSRFRGNLKKI